MVASSRSSYYESLVSGGIIPETCSSSKYQSWAGTRLRKLLYFTFGYPLTAARTAFQDSIMPIDHPLTTVYIRLGLEEKGRSIRISIAGGAGSSFDRAWFDSRRIGSKDGREVEPCTTVFTSWIKSPIKLSLLHVQRLETLCHGISEALEG
jgi:hypothetical protein